MQSDKRRFQTAMYYARIVKNNHGSKMDQNIPNDAAKAGAAANAVSIFGSAGAGMDEFPVLKAFQQYIDAEQAKARKRMLGLSVFFIVLMVLVVAIFAMILMFLLQRTQEQSDRLIELAYRDRAAQQAPVAPVVVNQPTHQQEMIKPLLDQIANLASALKEKAAPPPQPVQPPTVATPTDAQAEIQRKLDAEIQRLAEERAQLKAEREQARKDEIERQRRRLYPEYYARQDRAAAAAAEAERALAVQSTLPAPVAPAPAATPLPSPAPVKVSPAPVVAVPREAPAAAPQAVAPLPAPQPVKATPTGSDAAPAGTVDYVLPVGTRKTKGVKWRVPIPE